MKKILILGPSKNAVSGVSSHINQIIASPLKEVFEFCYFQIGSQGRKEHILKRIFRTIMSPLFLAAEIRKKKPHIVHINPSIDVKSFLRDPIYLIVAKMMGCRTVYQIHGGDLPQDFCKNKPFRRMIFKSILLLPHTTVILADYIKKQYEEFFPSLKFHKILNAIELEPYSDCSPKCYNRDVFNFLYIGRLAHNKGVAESIEALSIVKQKRKDLNFVFNIAGSGPYENNLFLMAKKVGMHDYINFLGPVFGKEKISLWKRADLFLFPTYHKEGIPYSLIESLASYTPAITTGIGGIPEILENEVHGVIIDSPHPEIIAETIIDLFDNKEKLMRFSKACGSRARSYFGIDRFSIEFKSLYNNIFKIEKIGKK